MSNLRLINETTVSSTVAKVRIENVFSADFDIYKIVYDRIIQVVDIHPNLYEFIKEKRLICFSLSK